MWEHINHLILEDELLCYRDGHIKRVVVPEAAQQRLIQYIHQDLCHIGYKKLYEYMRDIYFWPQMRQTIEKVSRECVICAKRKVLTTPSKETFLPRDDKTLFEEVVMDIAHFLPSKTGKKYVLVMVDRFSKVVVLVPLRNQDENTLIAAIKNRWIYRFGKPRSFLSDRGKTFEGNKLREMCKTFNITQEFSSPYQHQSNGLAERTIRSLRDMVVTSSASQNDSLDWEELLPKIEFLLNTTWQSSIGCTPFEVLFRQKLNLHGTFNRLPHTQSNPMTVEHSSKSAYRLQMQDDEKRGHRIFQVGEEVLVKVEPHKLRKEGFRYEGPYKIVKFLTPHQVVLKYPRSLKPRRIEWLKKYTRPSN